MRIRLLISTVLFASIAAIGCNGGGDSGTDSKADAEFQKQLADAAANKKDAGPAKAPSKRGGLPPEALQHKDEQPGTVTEDKGKGDAAK
jgi:hypothetical protein